MAKLKQKNSIKVLCYRPFNKIFRIAIVMITLLNFNPSYAQGSGYYEVLEPGRPPSAFSTCCCSKAQEDENQSSYTCSYYEGSKCPDDTKQYKLSNYDCPNSLQITKSKKETEIDNGG